MIPWDLWTCGFNSTAVTNRANSGNASVPPAPQLLELSDGADPVLGQAAAADLLELSACTDLLFGLAVAADPYEVTAVVDLLLGWLAAATDPLAVTDDDDPADKLLTQCKGVDDDTGAVCVICFAVMVMMWAMKIAKLLRLYSAAFMRVAVRAVCGRIIEKYTYFFNNK
jgi:hypothetical protein